MMLIMMVLVMGAVGCPTCALSITPKWSPWDVSGASTTASSTIAWCFIHNKWQQASNGNTCATSATIATSANTAIIATSATSTIIVLPPHPTLLGASMPQAQQVEIVLLLLSMLILLSLVPVVLVVLLLTALIHQCLALFDTALFKKMNILFE